MAGPNSTPSALDSFKQGIAAMRKAVDSVELDDPTARKAALDKAFEEATGHFEIAAKALEPTPIEKGKKKGKPAAADAEDAGDGGDDEGTEDMSKALIEMNETMQSLVTKVETAQTRVTKAETDAVAARAEVAEIKKANRTRELTEEARELTTHVGGEVTKVVKTLEALDGNAEARENYVTTLKAANDAARNASLLTDRGYQTRSVMKGNEAIDAKAAELRKADPKLTVPQSIEKATDEASYLASLVPGSGTGAPSAARLH